jgi:hypothetical protein
MDEEIAEFIRARRIDSFQKLHFLLYLQRRPNLTATVYEFSERLHQGDIVLMSNIVTDLRDAGLLEADINDDRSRLHPDAQIRATLDQLAQAYEDPFVRQQILAAIIQL